MASSFGKVPIIDRIKLLKRIEALILVSEKISPNIAYRFHKLSKFYCSEYARNYQAFMCNELLTEIITNATSNFSLCETDIALENYFLMYEDEVLELLNN